MEAQGWRQGDQAMVGWRHGEGEGAVPPAAAPGGGVGGKKKQGPLLTFAHIRATWKGQAGLGPEAVKHSTLGNALLVARGGSA